MSPGRPPRGPRTGARILDGARELFDRDGTARVTTNHIAAHVGISPGNLYYWYRDKEQIIRALWDRYAAAQAGLLSDDAEPGGGFLGPDGPTALVGRLAAQARLDEEYRFLARELPALVHLDPLLRASVEAAHDRRTSVLTTVVRAWRADGVLAHVTDERLADLVAALLLVTDASSARFPHAGHAGHAGQAGHAGRAAHAGHAAADAHPDAARLLTAVLEPYLAGPVPAVIRPADATAGHDRPPG